MQYQLWLPVILFVIIVQMSEKRRVRMYPQVLNFIQLLKHVEMETLVILPIPNSPKCVLTHMSCRLSCLGDDVNLTSMINRLIHFVWWRAFGADAEKQHSKPNRFVSTQSFKSQVSALSFGDCFWINFLSQFVFMAFVFVQTNLKH